MIGSRSSLTVEDMRDQVAKWEQQNIIQKKKTVVLEKSVQCMGRDHHFATGVAANATITSV